MNAKKIETEMSDDDLQEMITGLYGTVKIGCCEFDTGLILRELDPIAFRCSKDDLDDDGEKWICGECETEFDTEEEANDCCKE